MCIWPPDAGCGMRCKAQNAAMPIGIASICNAAARRQLASQISKLFLDGPLAGPGAAAGRVAA